MTIPFKGSQAKLKTVTVDSPCGLSLDIPTRGYASAKEYNEVSGVLLNLGTSVNVTKSANASSLIEGFEKDVVIIMLRSRFNDYRSTVTQLLEDKDGENISAPMLKLLYNFFSNELGLDSVEMPMGDFDFLKHNDSELIPLEEV